MLKLKEELHTCFIIEDDRSGKTYYIEKEYETFRAIRNALEKEGISLYRKSMKQIVEDLLYIENILSLTERIATFNPTTNDRVFKAVFRPM